MQAHIVKVGNSKGVRIPKTLLSQAQLHDKVNIELKDGGLLITPISNESAYETMLLSESALSDWNTPEEDAAWAHLQ
jgi:antitoxin MazE